MKKIFTYFTTLILIASVNLKAQELPLVNQYLFNKSLLNPAFAGINHFKTIRITDRHQWVGIADAPQTITANLQARFGEHNGVGIGLFSDRYGAISNVGLHLTYAFHGTIAKAAQRDYDHRFAIGLTGNIARRGHDWSNLTFNEPNDPLNTGTMEKYLFPDASFGVYFYNGKYFLGLSTTHLTYPVLEIGEITHDKEIYGFVEAGYRFKVNKNIDFEPSVLFKKTESSPLKCDFNARCYYKRDYWLAVSYRMYIPDAYSTNNSLLILLGLKIYENLYLGYAFDYTTGNIMNNCFGSHELMLGYDFGMKEHVCRAFR